MSPLRNLLVILVSLVSFLAACTPNLQEPAAPFATEAGPTGIGGRITDQRHTPQQGVWVYAYRSQKSGLRGPADFETRSGSDGGYFLDLVEGSYHLVARMRQGGGDAGPPRVGDAWALPPSNPVTVFQDRTTLVDFRLAGITSPRLMREGTLTSGTTGFRGRAVDSEGKPLPGVIAMAYTDADHRRMPDFTAPAADEHGHFVLFVPEGGSYCLAARTRTRGQPRQGEPYGQIGFDTGRCLPVKAGQIRDIGEIVLTPYYR